MGTVAGGCFYFSFDQNWRKYGILVLLGPKNVETEKHALIAQVLAFKSLIYIKKRPTLSLLR